MKITIETSIKDFYFDLKNQNIDGLTVKVFTKDSLKGVVVAATVTYIVTVTSESSVELFKVWLNNKVQAEVKESTVINGNQINIENINITNISNYLDSDQHNQDSKSKAD